MVSRALLPQDGSIVNRGEWLRNPANIKGANKDFKIYVGRSTTVHNLLFCSHRLYMNYVTNTFLLVSSSVRSKQLLCFVYGQGQKREQKHKTKNFHEFHNHSPLLTLMAGFHVPWTEILKFFPTLIFLFIFGQCGDNCK